MTLTGTTSELVSLVFIFEYCHLSFLKAIFDANLKCFEMLASMARKIYLRGVLGVGVVHRIYGDSKRNGSAPPHFCKAVVVLLITFFSNCKV